MKQDSEPSAMDVEQPVHADDGAAALLRLQNMMVLSAQLRLPIIYKVNSQTHSCGCAQVCCERRH